MTYATYPGGASPAAFVNLLATRTRSFAPNPHASKVGNLTDPFGGTDAAEWSLGDGVGTGITGGNLASVIVGEPTWIEVWLKTGATGTPLTEAIVAIDFASGAGNSHFQRHVQVDATWRKRRFRWIPRDISATLRFSVQSLNATDAAKTIQVAFPRVYHSREPQTLDGIELMSSGGTLARLGIDDNAALTGVTSNQTRYARTLASRWYTPSGVTGTLVMVANKLYGMPFDVLDAETLTRIALEITGAGSAGSVIRLGVYGDSTGLPGARLLDAGTIDGTVLYSTTPGQITSLSLALPVGRYYLSAAGQGSPATQPTVRTCIGPHSGVGLAGSTPPANTSNGGWGETGTATSGALPDPFPANDSLGSVPRVCFRT